MYVIALAPCMYAIAHLTKRAGTMRRQNSSFTAGCWGPWLMGGGRAPCAAKVPLVLLDHQGDHQCKPNHLPSVFGDDLG
jgi:hypothetical protein